MFGRYSTYICKLCSTILYNSMDEEIEHVTNTELNLFTPKRLYSNFPQTHPSVLTKHLSIKPCHFNQITTVMITCQNFALTRPRQPLKNPTRGETEISQKWIALFVFSRKVYYACAQPNRACHDVEWTSQSCQKQMHFECSFFEIINSNVVLFFLLSYSLSVLVWAFPFDVRKYPTHNNDLSVACNNLKIFGYCQFVIDFVVLIWSFFRQKPFLEVCLILLDYFFVWKPVF